MDATFHISQLVSKTVLFIVARLVSDVALTLGSLCHTLTVKRLLWRPCRRDGDHSSAAKELVLSSCSLDSCVKVFSVRLE